MPNFGFSNIYLKAGLALMVLALVLAGWFWAAMPWEQPTGTLVAWIATASLLGGVALYVIGRLAHVFRRRPQP